MTTAGFHSAGEHGIEYGYQLQDAQEVFVSMTNGTLVANAAALGLTVPQARQLERNYAEIPNGFTTTVEAVKDIEGFQACVAKELRRLTGHDSD